MTKLCQQDYFQSSRVNRVFLPAKGYCEIALLTQRFLPRVLLFPPCNRVLPFLSIFNRTVSSTPFCGSCLFQQSANRFMWFVFKF
ncbi:hypothetical protein Gasu2_69470 [Galdieria sulphuraria]|nr:hypothetical protein Gasu2_69470 [Galdieria sulphuraria]